MKNRRVSILSGGGGPLLTGTIEESKAYNCDSELRERAEALSGNVKHTCHAELADLRTVERSENRLASRLSLLEQSSLGETLRAWSKSKTVSASIRRCVLPVTMARSRNGLARLAENVPTCFQHSALRSLARAVRNDTAGQGGFLFRLVVKMSCSTLVDGTQCLYQGRDIIII